MTTRPADAYTVRGVNGMRNDIWLALLLVTHVVGVAAIAHFLMLRLLRPEKDAPCVWLLEVRSAARARDRLYALHLRRELLGEGNRCVIIAVDAGVEEAEKREILRFCASIPRMYWCEPQALPALLSTL